ncbi:MAG: ABC transporter ATP-binding protein [Chloroflexi bacterium]|nr:ABC transporter ATP-binding protein [Chloroflexota bacterium]
MNISLSHYRDLLTTYLKPQRRKVAMLTALLLGSIGLQLLNPQILRSFIDTATSAGSGAGSFQRLLVLAGLFIAVALISQAVTVAATYLSEQVGWTATNLLRSDLARHCLRLDMSFHHARTPGELIERIDGDITALSTFFSQLVIKIFGSGLLMVGVLVVLFLEDARIGAALTLFALLALVVLTLIRNFAVDSMAADRQAHAVLFGFLEERIAGLDDLRANGAGGYVMRRLYQTMRDVVHLAHRAAMRSSTVWIVTMGMFALGYALALGLGAYLYSAGAISIGTVYLFFQYTEMLRRPLEQISEQIKEFQRATASIGRVQELFAVQSTITDGPGATFPSGPLAVEFDAVTFGYGDDAPVLKDISFALVPGTVLGLLGRTGSGKTTLTRLLFRLYDISDGAIRLGGVELSAAKLHDLRQRIGIVTQDVQLFQATVRDNLTLFDPTISDAQIMQALTDLELLPWLQSLPDGLDTELAAGNNSVSAGEAQLLAFARVFLKDPGLVILDEASSRLDPATEARIERAVDKLLRNRTGIIIAHRLATVQRADEILLLERGRIVEEGPRARLADDPDSRFAQLLQTGMAEVLA